MKALLVSDLHFSSRAIDQHFWELFPQMEELIYLEKIDEVWILGDLTTAKDNHAADLVNNLVNNLAKLAQKVKVKVLRGNHDGIDANIPYFEFLKNIPGIEYIKSIREFDTSYNPSVLFLPHSRQPKEDWGQVEFKNKIVMAHVTVDGAWTESGIELKSDIDSAIFREAKLVLSGDIHAPQELKYLVYVGCPYNIRFNDNFSGGGIVLTLPGDGTFDWQRVKFTFPRRYTFDIVDYESFLTTHEKAKEGDQIKVRLHLDETNSGKWRDIKQSVMGLCDMTGVKLCSFEMVNKKVESIKTEVKQTETVDFSKICTDLKITPELVEVGKKIMAEVG